MAKVREYQFTTGIETSTIPNPGTPSADADTVSLGYLNDKSAWGEDVASYAAMRALTTAERADYQTRFVSGTEEDWYFNPSSTATDDGAAVLEPDDSPVTGRWLIKTSGGGGGGGGGTSGVETLMQKLENEKYSVISEDLDNSAGLSGAISAAQRSFTATLLKNASVSDTSVEVVWNAKHPSASDLNMDSATGWTAVGAGTNLAASSTAGNFQVGSAGLGYDKTTGNVEAEIRNDIGAQTFQLNGNSIVYRYVKLSSITDLSNVFVKVYADSTSNYQKFTKTTDYAGNAFIVGWNLIRFDLADGSGVATGSGWDISKLARYIGVGVTTGSASQTYTGIYEDSLYFSYYRPQDLGVIGSELTLFNTSTKEDIVITAANTRHDGALAISAALSNAYNGGLSGTARGRVQRSTMTIAGDGQMAMDGDSSFSGAITTAQELRFSTYFRETISGDADTFVDVIAAQNYEITTVGGSIIDVSDAGDQTASLKNGNTLDFFRPYRVEGKTKFVFIKSANMTADATHSSGTTTITVAPASLAVGDVVVKRLVSQVAQSVVSVSNAESFQAQSFITDPNGVQLIDNGLGYFNPGFIYAHYWCGGPTTSDALRNRFPGGAGPQLTVAASPSLAEAGQRGRFSSTGNNTNYTYIDATTSLAISAISNKVQHSFWMYYGGTVAANRSFMARTNGTNGYTMRILNGENILRLRGQSTTTTGIAMTVGWHHVVVVLNESGNSYFYLDGVKSDVISVSYGDPSTRFSPITAQSYEDNNAIRVMELVTQLDGPTITAAQALTMANGGSGVFKEIGPGYMERLRYATTGVSGQRASMRVRTARTTTAVVPTIWKTGIIVS